ncbi:MAG: nitroreductase family protein [Lentisphaeria bacterium]
MNFIELAKKRYSVRQFDSKSVGRDVLEQVLEAGRVAPTANNRQPQRVYILQGEESMVKIKKCTQCHFNAPVVLLFLYDQTEAWVRPFDGMNFGAVDVSIVMTHMMLQAFDLGLGSTWVEFFEPDKISAEFNLPENLIPAGLLPLGYPKSGVEPALMHEKRKANSELVTWM